MPIGDSRYFLMFIDDYSRNNVFNFLKEKNQIKGVFNEFKDLIENHQENTIKIFKSK